MTELSAFVLVGLGTYAFRASGLLHRRTAGGPSPTLGLIAPVVLAAIVADQLFVERGAIEVRADWTVAAIVSGVVAWRTRSAALTMAAGLLVAWAVGGVS